MKLYQVEIFPSRCALPNGRWRFEVVRAEDYERAKQSARQELCQPGESVFGISEVLEDDRELVPA